MDKSKLTSREKQVARTILQYRKLKKAADVLGISICTIKFHAVALRHKLKASSTFAAAHEANEKSLLD